MSKKQILIIVITLIFSIGATKAQDNQPEETKKTVAERIVEESEGRISIDIPDEILKSLEKHNNKHYVKGKSTGWRILVFFDGRNQQSLERRAKSRANAIVRRFPKYSKQVYHKSKAPNWLTQVGNFTSHEAAGEALAELKKAFPSFANEMLIVTSEIESQK